MSLHSTAGLFQTKVGLGSLLTASYAPSPHPKPPSRVPNAGLWICSQIRRGDDSWEHDMQPPEARSGRFVSPSQRTPLLRTQCLHCQLAPPGSEGLSRMKEKGQGLGRTVAVFVLKKSHRDHPHGEWVRIFPWVLCCWYPKVSLKVLLSSLSPLHPARERATRLTS